MTMSPNQSEIIQKWISKADHDLLIADHSLTLPEDQCPFDIVCFHAQQAAEKYLKAILMSRTINFPRTHDLTELMGLLPADITLGVSSLEIASLTPYAVQARYPGLTDDQDSEEALAAVRIARQIQAAANKIFPNT
jgi:HEPN domain-containing protein